MKKFGTPELDRILERLEELADAVLRRCSARPKGASRFTDARAFLRRMRTYTDLLRCAGTDRHRTCKLMQESRRKRSFRCSAARRRSARSAALHAWKRRRQRLRLLDGAARPRLLPAGHADRCFRASWRSSLFDKLDTRGPDLGHAGRGGRLRFRAEAAGPARARARWWCPAISTIRSRRCSMCRSICPIRAIRRFTEARRGRDRRASWNTAAAARSCCSPAISRCAWCTTASRWRSNIPTLMQGTGPRNALLDEFRATPNCVLFATSSFWQGVDVPGEQLSCVIIDKLPFAVPSDPVVEARIENIRESRRQSVLRLPDSAGRHRAEAGIRAADPQPVGSRRAGAAG